MMRYNTPQVEAYFDKANPTEGHIAKQQNAPADGRGVPMIESAGPVARHFGVCP